MSDVALLPVLAAAAVAAVLAWLAIRSGIARLPLEDRRWRDRPPVAWRLAWPVIAPCAGLLAPLLPARWCARRTRALRQAGLDLALDAPHVAAGYLVGAAVGAALAAWAMHLVSAAAPPWPGAIAGAGGASTDPQRWTSVAIALGASLGVLWPAAWLRERAAFRMRAIARALPFYLDVVTLSVESGANLTGALQHAVAKGPAGPLRIELERVLRDLRAGRARADALRALAERLELPGVSSWVAAMVAAERNGNALGPILRAQAEQRRHERFQHAEKLAMKAPVKMLFPLLAFIFPCTFVLIFFPVVVRLIEEGLLR